MIIRHATPGDMPAILNLDRQVPELAHWSEQAYRAVFEAGAPQRTLLVCEANNALEAFLIARFTSEECELENIVVYPGRRRQGIATELLQSLIATARAQSARRILLEVRESNISAVSFYRKLRFEETGRRKSYYVNPLEDAILYTLNL
jgi:[ribosomal protein S18]-alanine N-acetyltransferase